MSANIATPDAVALLIESYNANYFAVAAATLIIFDHVLTISQEVRLFWGRKWTAVTYIFTANRLLASVFAAACMLSAVDPPTVTGCMSIVYFEIIPELVLFVLWAVFSALRVYAIGGRAVVSALVVFGLFLAPFATNIYLSSTATFNGVVTVGHFSVCVNSRPESAQSNTGSILPLQESFHHSDTLISLEIWTQSSQMLADTIVILITWLRMWGLRRAANGDVRAPPLATILFRDGTVYFVAQLILNAMQLWFYLATEARTDLFYFTTTLTSITMSRFLLNLRQVEYNPVNLSTGSPYLASRVSDMRFASFVKSMGAEVDDSVIIGTAPYGLGDGDLEWDDAPEEIDAAAIGAAREDHTVDDADIILIV